MFLPQTRTMRVVLKKLIISFNASNTPQRHKLPHHFTALYSQNLTLHLFEKIEDLKNYFFNISENAGGSDFSPLRNFLKKVGNYFFEVPYYFSQAPYFFA